MNSYLNGVPTPQWATTTFFTQNGAGDGHGLLYTYVGVEGRYMVEDLMRYDIAVALGCSTPDQQALMQSLATDFVTQTFGATPADFPAVGVNTGNLWLENVIALGLTALDFPNAPYAQQWLNQ